MTDSDTVRRRSYMPRKNSPKVGFEELANAEILAAIRYLDPDCAHDGAALAICVTRSCLGMSWPHRALHTERITLLLGDAVKGRFTRLTEDCASFRVEMILSAIVRHFTVSALRDASELSTQTDCRSHALLRQTDAQNSCVRQSVKFAVLRDKRRKDCISGVS